MVTVVRWTGREAKALREALRMSGRDFANHTGLSTSTIADMEAKGDQAHLRHATQQLFDNALAKALLSHVWVGGYRPGRSIW